MKKRQINYNVIFIVVFVFSTILYLLFVDILGYKLIIPKEGFLWTSLILNVINNYKYINYVKEHYPKNYEVIWGDSNLTVSMVGIFIFKYIRKDQFKYQYLIELSNDKNVLKLYNEYKMSFWIILYSLIFISI